MPASWGTVAKGWLRKRGPSDQGNDTRSFDSDSALQSKGQPGVRRGQSADATTSSASKVQLRPLCSSGQHTFCFKSYTLNVLTLKARLRVAQMSNDSAYIGNKSRPSQVPAKGAASPSRTPGQRACGQSGSRESLTFLPAPASLLCCRCLALRPADSAGASESGDVQAQSCSQYGSRSPSGSAAQGSATLSPSLSPTIGGLPSIAWLVTGHLTLVGRICAVLHNLQLDHWLMLCSQSGTCMHHKKP